MSILHSTLLPTVIPRDIRYGACQKLGLSEISGYYCRVCLISALDLNKMDNIERIWTANRGQTRHCVSLPLSWDPRRIPFILSQTAPIAHPNIRSCFYSYLQPPHSLRSNANSPRHPRDPKLNPPHILVHRGSALFQSLILDESVLGVAGVVQCGVYDSA
ncbi:hypothetical protein BJX99DRAFT_202230 [Aspergillus californicus]